MNTKEKTTQHNNLPTELEGKSLFQSTYSLSIEELIFLMSKRGWKQFTSNKISPEKIIITFFKDQKTIDSVMFTLGSIINVRYKIVNGIEGSFDTTDEESVILFIRDNL